MMIKAINIMLGILVALTVWGAALVFAVFIAMLALQIAAVSGLTVYHLVHS